MAKDHRPSFQFYPGDWLKDAELRRCSLAARGLWIDLLCYMHECGDRGVLASGGSAWSDQQIADIVCGPQRAVVACLHELLEAGVADRTAFGAIFCRRMVRDEELRRIRAGAGKKGGEATAKGYFATANRTAKRVAKRQQTVEDEDEVEEKKKKGDTKARKTADPVPEDQIEVIYRAYPRRVGKKRAVPHIRAAIREVGLEALLAKVRAFAASKKGADPKYTKHPERWFRDRQWEDEIEVPTEQQSEFKLAWDKAK